MPFTSIFYFSQNVFYPSQNKIHLFSVHLIICKCFEFGPVVLKLFWITELEPFTEMCVRVQPFSTFFQHPFMEFFSPVLCLMLFLTLYHTIPTLHNPEEGPFKNIVEKEENAGNGKTSIFFFSHNVSVLPITNFAIWITFIIFKCFQFGLV